MTDEGQRFISRVSGGGIAAEHLSQDTYSVFAGPSTSDEYNTIRVPLLPRACWRLEDVRFDFDSSFINPPAAEEFRNLSTLMNAHPGAPVSIFGHADPVGDDDYNKKLSGRRATAVYGMLTRNTDLWEELYSNPLGRDDWRNKAVQIILLDLGYTPGSTDGKTSPETTEATKKFQSGNGLPPTGNADRATRAKLFRAYMDKHCRDEKGNPFKLENKDFLARGEDSGGKGDYQGCSEFNPLLMFSQEEYEEYKKEENKAKRDSENAPNRRVLVYLFRPGSHVSPSWWPCPRVKEGIAGCKKRFWHDAQKRRTFQEKRREYDKDKDTFACRFYQLRMASRSPCESILEIFVIRLYDPSGKYIPNAPCRITLGEQEGYLDRANGDGTIILREIETPKSCRLEWGFEPKEGKKPDLIFRLDMMIVAREESEEEELKKKLNNLGYADAEPKINVKGFQRDYGHLTDPPLLVTGEMDERTKKLLKDVYGECAPDLKKRKGD